VTACNPPCRKIVKEASQSLTRIVSTSAALKAFLAIY
jgi:hypothetical protein